MLNLEIARKDKGIAIVDIADYLDLRSQTVREKIRGKYPFTVREAMLIQKKFFPEYDFTYLFTQNKDNQ